MPLIEFLGKLIRRITGVLTYEEGEVYEEKITELNQLKKSNSPSKQADTHYPRRNRKSASPIKNDNKKFTYNLVLNAKGRFERSNHRRGLKC